MAGHLYSPLPRDVPGYGEAVAAGLTPARPPHPPSLRPGTTAHHELVRCGIVLAVASALTVVTMFLPGDGNEATVAEMAMFIGVTVAGIVAVTAAMRRFRRILLAELAAGYVTTTFYQASFWFVASPGPRRSKGLMAWDWDGIWVLNQAGEVVTEPDPDVDPPGMYPSPNRPGHLELWTGTQWTGVYADPGGMPH